MSVHDETWDKCCKCGKTQTGNNQSYHDRGDCVAETTHFNHSLEILREKIEEIIPDYKAIAERLWEILDDIDTASDHYKPDNNDKYVRYVYAKVKEKDKYMSSPDGHTLKAIPKNKMPVVEDLDPMTRWFKDAWQIEKDNDSQK